MPTIDLSEYSFTKLMAECLAEIPDDVDKREGSIIYDALAPACYRLADLYMHMNNIYRDTFASTAYGENLDLRASEHGISRYLATYAYRKLYVTDSTGNPMTIPVGARFSTKDDVNPLNYTVFSSYNVNEHDEYDPAGTPVPGYYVAMCEEPGTKGNEYFGEMLNISNVNNIGEAILQTIIIAARDTETDDDFRTRYFESVQEKAFGGNIAAYKKTIEDIGGVGGVQVYPAWNGGGTVLCSVIDAEYRPISNEFASIIQNTLDPVNAHGDQGDGLGLVPIGHQVTITTPTEVTVDFSATVTLAVGTNISDVLSQAEVLLENYIESISKGWGTGDMYNNYAIMAYISKVSSIILSIEGVVNVTNVMMNNAASDITFTQTAQLQEIPKFGEVTLNE